MSLPRPKQGAKVSFWKQYPPQGLPDLGWVLQDGERAQRVMVIGKFGVRVFDTVRHKTDPDLPNNPAWHPEGVWDYHPDEARLNNLEQQVSNLEQVVAELLARAVASPAPEPKKSGWTEERRAEARERMMKARAAKAAKALQAEAAV